MMPLEGKENELQQTKDQKGSLEVNRQARKTQPERDHKAKEEVREGKRPKQRRDLKTELEEEVREDLSQSYFTRPPPALPLPRPFPSSTSHTQLPNHTTT